MNDECILNGKIFKLKLSKDNVRIITFTLRELYKELNKLFKQDTISYNDYSYLNLLKSIYFYDKEEMEVKQFKWED